MDLVGMFKVRCLGCNVERRRLADSYHLHVFVVIMHDLFVLIFQFQSSVNKITAKTTKGTFLDTRCVFWAVNRSR